MILLRRKLIAAGCLAEVGKGGEKGTKSLGFRAQEAQGHKVHAQGIGHKGHRAQGGGHRSKDIWQRAKGQGARGRG